MAGKDLGEGQRSGAIHPLDFLLLILMTAAWPFWLGARSTPVPAHALHKL